MVGRSATLRRNGVAASVQSDSPAGIGWFLTFAGFPTSASTTNRTVFGTYTGSPAFHQKVWSVEQRPTTPSGGPFVTRLARYDTATQLQDFAIDWPTSQTSGQNLVPTRSGLADANMKASSQDCFLSIVALSGSGNLYIVDGAGTLSNNAFTAVTSTVVEQLDSGQTKPAGWTYDYTKTTTNSADCLAWRDAPIGAGSETIVYAPRSPDLPYPSPAISVTNESRLYIGIVSVVGGKLTVAKNVVLESFDTIEIGEGAHNLPVTTYRWVQFDQCYGHWAGVVERSIVGGPTPSTSLLVLIDGGIAKTFDLPGGSSSFPYADLVGSIHVCHPHETLGDGWVAVPVLTNTNPALPWEIIVYKDGSESWRMPPMKDVFAPGRFRPFVSQSGDRWLYVPDLQNTETSYHPFDHFRHDGSAMWITGQLNPAGTDTLRDAHSPGAFGVQSWLTVLQGFAVVQNSNQLGHGLPLEWPPAL